MLLPELRARSAFWRYRAATVRERFPRSSHYREHRANEWFVEGVYD